MILDASKTLPFHTEELDYVYSSHALEDMSDTENVLKEWVRILKPWANIILYVPHPDLYNGNNTHHKFGGFTIEVLSSILKNMGCVIVEGTIIDYSTLVVAVKLPLS